MNNEEYIYGYKSFNVGGRNIKGIIMPPGKYHFDGDIIYGRQGYHFAEYLEDTLEYTDTDSPLIAYVRGSGTIDKCNYAEFESGNLYAVSDIEILKYLNRDEILHYALALDEVRMIRFIDRYSLSKDELDIFSLKSSNVKKFIEDSISQNGFVGRSKILVKK